jgi:hypothetical protein
MSPDYTYIDTTGTKRVMFHRKGLKAWEHPVDKPYMIDNGEVKPCPECDRSYKP